MNDERDLTPTEQDPETGADAGAADDLPLTSGVDAFAPSVEGEDAVEAVMEDAPPEYDADDETFSYDQFSQGLESLVPTDPALDIEAALAAINVSTGSRAPEAPTFVPVHYAPTLPMPPVQRLKRGSLPSIVPAIILIALGIWLTVQTTTDVPIDSRIVLAAGIGGLVVTLLAAWIAWGRWSRGLLLPALLISAIGGVVAAGLIPGGLDLTRGYPLLATAVGAAVLLTALLGRPSNRRMLAAGLALALAGGLGLLITNGFIAGDWIASAAPLWPIPVVLLIAIWLAPLVFRRRSR